MAQTSNSLLSPTKSMAAKGNSDWLEIPTTLHMPKCTHGHSRVLMCTHVQKDSDWLEGPHHSQSNH